MSSRSLLVPKIALIALLLPCLATAADTLPSPAAFDVAGVKLGMTKAEATSALKAYDPNGIFQEPKADGTSATKIWNATPNLIFLSRDFHNIDALPWDQKQLISDCYKRTGPCKLKDKDESNKLLSGKLSAPRVVTVWLSVTPNKEAVIAVSSTTTYVKPVPTVSDLRAEIAKHYAGPPSVASDTHDGPVIVWEFDARARLMASAQAAKTPFPGFVPFDPAKPPYACVYGFLAGHVGGGICPDVYLPGSVRKGDGVALAVWVRNGFNGGGVQLCDGTPTTLPQTSCEHESENKLLADQLVLMLYDGSALASFGEPGRSSKN